MSRANDDQLDSTTSHRVFPSLDGIEGRVIG